MACFLKEKKKKPNTLAKPVNIRSSKEGTNILNQKGEREMIYRLRERIKELKEYTAKLLCK